MNPDISYMRRCLRLAKNAMGHTSPNPMVGAVIVHKGKIIGEGYHCRSGHPHAEVNAINAVSRPKLLCGSTLYVNLEPCSHYGKTPPCADLIIEKGIPRVVVATLDPNEQVAGRGVERMRKAGAEVEVGLLAQEAWQLNRRFFTFHTQKRPYIVLKWAQTLDGYIDRVRSKDTPIQPNWITNRLARISVHKWRAEEDAIMVGTQTAAKDNPQLNIREWAGNNPVRIVIDKNLELPGGINLFDQQIPTWVFNSKKESISGKIILKKVTFNYDNEAVARQILQQLYAGGLQSVFVEGGAATLQTFIRADLWDEARMFIGNTFFRDGVKAPQLRNELLLRQENFGHSKLFVFRNGASPQ